MARAGLGEGWTCRFANDCDPKKAMTHQANWGVGGELRIGDIAALDPSDLPGQADKHPQRVLLRNRLERVSGSAADA